jgi:phosphosulfolactate synthase (CoM biosynthesis protein A)
MGHHVDGLKFAGGSFSLFPEDKLKELINLAHEYNVYVSTVSLFAFLKALLGKILGWMDGTCPPPI